jgi:hypothetical protein
MKRNFSRSFNKRQLLVNFLPARTKDAERRQLQSAFNRLNLTTTTFLIELTVKIKVTRQCQHLLYNRPTMALKAKIAHNHQNKIG